MNVYVVFVKGELIAVVTDEQTGLDYAERTNPGALPDEIEIKPMPLLMSRVGR